MKTTGTRGPSGKKLAMLAIGVLGAASLSVSALTASATHAAWGRGHQSTSGGSTGGVNIFSHRLAGGVLKPYSLRLV